MRSGWTWLALCVVASTALSGCFDPHRVTVPAATIQASGLDWNVTERAQEGGFFGTKTVETLYSHDPADPNPPFGGVLQVFALRGGDRKSTDELLAFTRDVVDDAVAREGIQVDERSRREGSRELRNGVGTKWFNLEGTVRSASGLFFDEDDITVRVHGEVGFDGRSSTGFVAIAFVQVARETDVILPTGSQQEDLRTWMELVADPAGSVDGASYADKDRGFIYNLRTHA